LCEGGFAQRFVAPEFSGDGFDHTPMMAQPRVQRKVSAQGSGGLKASGYRR
jgi:hypothetical protein